MEKLGKHRWSLRLYGGVTAVLIAGVNTIWGGIAADWASYYFTAFNFLVGPIFIAITGKYYTDKMIRSILNSEFTKKNNFQNVP